MELKKIWEIIWHRKWIIIQAFFIITLTAVIGSYRITPSYETSAKVLIETSDTASSIMSSIGLEDFSSMLGVAGSETETDMELAMVAPVIEKVIAKLQVRTDRGNLMEPGQLVGPGFLLATIFPKTKVEITPVEDTNLFQITARSMDPKEAAMIANTLAEVYVNESLKRRRAEYRSARKFIEDRIRVSRADYLDALEEIKRFKISNKTVDIQRETSMAIDKMAELMKEKEDNVIDIYEVRAKIATLKAQLVEQDGMTVPSSAVSENPHIENLKKRLSDFELELAETLTEKTQDHPKAQALKQKIRKAEEELQKEMKVFQKSSLNLGTLERDLAALEAHLKGVNADIKRYLRLLYTLPDKAFNQSQLELKLSASQDIYSSLIEYFHQIGVAEAMTLSDIRLVEPAAEPDVDTPASPNRTLNGIMGAFLGLMFGFGLAFLVDYLDDTIKTPEETKEQGLTLLGIVPRFKRRESFLISNRDPKDPISETYRTLRNSLKFASLDKPVKSILITSSRESEGKTTTVSNLGISIANEGKKALLIDMDLRRPRLHEVFKASNLSGVTTILAGEASPEDVIKKTNVNGLSILPSGPVPPDPGRMVESVKMKQMINYLYKQYDIIILDSPPLLVVNDPFILAGYIDGVILVLESEKSTHRLVSQTVELLKDANIQPVGAVLNKFKVRSRGYYYYYQTGYYTGKKA